MAFSWQDLWDSLGQAYQYKVQQLPQEWAMTKRAFEANLQDKEWARQMDLANWQNTVNAQLASNALNENLYNQSYQRDAWERAQKGKQQDVRAASGLPSVLDTQYGGSSPGGVEGAKLSSMTPSSYGNYPQYVPSFGPAQGPRTTVNVETPQNYLFNPTERMIANWSSPNPYSQKEADEQTTYGPWKYGSYHW